ncbi:MAG: hypothetical protein AB7U61_00925 [Methylocystis sp.]
MRQAIDPDSNSRVDAIKVGASILATTLPRLSPISPDAHARFVQRDFAGADGARLVGAVVAFVVNMSGCRNKKEWQVANEKNNGVFVVADSLSSLLLKRGLSSGNLQAALSKPTSNPSPSSGATTSQGNSSQGSNASKHGASKK